MKNFFSYVLKTATFRQSSVTFVGTVLNGLLGALFYIVLARTLGPAEFGLLTVSIATLTLISDMADIGTNTGLIKFVSSNLQSNRQKAWEFLKLSLEVKLIVWLIAFIVVFFLSPFLTDSIFKKPELLVPLRLVAFGVGAALLFSYVTSALQAFQKYFLWSAVNIITNFLRLILVIILGYYLMLNVNNSLIIYIALPFFGFFLSLLMLPTRQILMAKNERSLSREFFKYNIPVAIFTIIAAFSARLDTFLNASLLSSKEVGIYGAASQLVQVVPQLVTALGVVAAPKFSNFQNKVEMVKYLKKFQLLVLALFVIGILSIPISVYLLPFIYGSAYQDAIIPFIFLFLAMLVFLFSVPVHNAIIFYYGRPDVFIWVSLGHLIIIAALGYFMIFKFGIIGASITVLVGTIFNFFYPLAWLLIRLKK